MHFPLLALQYDPTIRGLLIVIAAIVILPGSVYMLLATNVGAKMGIWLALAGLFGWLTILSSVWTVYALAQGPRGRPPAWTLQEVITGNLAQQNTVDVMQNFPAGWHKLPAGNKILGDAQAAADRVLAPPAPVPTNGKESTTTTTLPPSQPRFKSPFSKTSDYIPVGGYDFGGQRYFPLGIRSDKGFMRSHGFFNWFHDRGFIHKPHYALIQVAPVVPPAANATTVAPPRADPSKPVTSVVMLRDLGEVRLFPAKIFVVSFSLFLMVCTGLHIVDKRAMQARAQTPSPVPAPA